MKRTTNLLKPTDYKAINYYLQQHSGYKLMLSSFDTIHFKKRDGDTVSVSMLEIRKEYERDHSSKRPSS